MCQLCDKVGHSAKVCHSRPQPQFSPQANFMASDLVEDMTFGLLTLVHPST